MQQPIIKVPDSFKSSSFNYLRDYLKNNREKILEQLLIYGVIIFRGYDVSSIQQFEILAKSLTSNLTDYRGGDSPRKKISPYVYTSTEYSQKKLINLHNEKSFSKYYPNYIYFYCEKPAQIGGETLIAYNRELYKKLDNEIIEEYSRKKIKYIMNFHNIHGFGKSWQQAFETENKASVEIYLEEKKINYSWYNDDCLKIYEIVDPIINHPSTKDKLFFSQTHQWHPSFLDRETYFNYINLMPQEQFYQNCCYGDDTLLNESHLQKIINVLANIKIKIKLLSKDFVVMDNLLVMHGRMPFVGDRKLYVTMT